MSPKGFCAQSIFTVACGETKGKRLCGEISRDQITQGLEYQAEELELSPEALGSHGRIGSKGGALSALA